MACPTVGDHNTEGNTVRLAGQCWQPGPKADPGDTRANRRAIDDVLLGEYGRAGDAGGKWVQAGAE